MPRLLSLALSLCMATTSALVPAFPTPQFSWATLPIAFHGANKARMYTDAEVAQLARYSMVTLEKWYTPCGAQHPTQAGPECDIEDKMYDTFRAIKAVNPNVTTVLYLNSMFNFAFYHLNGVMLARERAGEPSLLRDLNGTLVELCNDGNARLPISAARTAPDPVISLAQVYCNITNFDWSVPEVADLWVEAVTNATLVGGVDGVFADHGFEHGVMPSKHDLQPPSDPQLCNGKGDQAECYHFTEEFAERFNAGHDALLNRTQDLLSSTTGGPVIDGPYAAWGYSACDFTTLRDAVMKGREGAGPRVIEASNGACSPDETCFAAFLCAADQYTYMACFGSQNNANTSEVILPKFYDEYSKPLGAPLSDAVEVSPGVWRREFESGTVAVFNETSGNGTVAWSS